METKLIDSSIPGLDRLAARAREELALTAHPRLDWVPATEGPDGQPALDVLIVGAGQGGCALAFQLKRDRVQRVMTVDQAPAGGEGVWNTFARMPTLRSPKDYTGPDLDIPSLTYQAWHQAKYGNDAWEALDLIRTADWAEYLLWVRKVTEVDVHNDTRVVAIVPPRSDGTAGGTPLFEVKLETHGNTRSVFTRRVVLASGQDGAGRWWTPAFVSRLPEDRWAHAADEIDFQALAGKRVAILGAGASAADNASVALESGASEVRMYVRRPVLQRIQPYRWITFRGFLRHLHELDDAWRWRFMQRVLAMRESIPQATYDRMRCHENFHLHTDCAWEAVRVDEGSGELVIGTRQGEFRADYIIAGTGVDIDFAAKPELRNFASCIRTWADAYEPPPAERDERLARYPYLDDHGAYMEKVPGEAPYLSSVFDFTIAATMSFGPSGASINAMTTAVPRLSRGITRSLFREDVDYHWDDFLAYDTPVFVPYGEDEGK